MRMFSLEAFIRSAEREGLQVEIKKVHTDQIIHFIVRVHASWEDEEVYVPAMNMIAQWDPRSEVVIVNALVRFPHLFRHKKTRERFQEVHDDHWLSDTLFQADAHTGWVPTLSRIVELAYTDAEMVAFFLAESIVQICEEMFDAYAFLYEHIGERSLGLHDN